jgi:glucoamylase
MTADKHASQIEPSVSARWTHGNKDAIGTAIEDASRVWFSTSMGVLSEVFYPTPDQACLRLVEFIVADGPDFVAQERGDMVHVVPQAPDDVPIGRQLNRCKLGRFEIAKEIIADPRSDVILLQVRFTPLRAGRYRLFCVIEPHLGNAGIDNAATVETHQGAPVLCGFRDDGLALALACSAPLVSATAGSAAEIDRAACGDEFTCALGFGRVTTEAVHLAVASLQRGFAAARDRYVASWQAWHASLTEPHVDGRRPRLWRRSATILKVLEAKRPHGGRVAALATPWGDARGPGIDGTYHLVWTRDLIESVGALLAAGARDEATRALNYLASTQAADGHWPQNMRIDGTAVWTKIELDEIALPIVFLHLLRENGALAAHEVTAYWPMVRRAAGYLARTGPASLRDRWEDTAGITPFTIASMIVALLVASELAEAHGEALAAGVLRDLADQWNASIERWLYRRGGPLALSLGVDGYYVRARAPGTPFPELDPRHLPPTEISPDALALVRFGLRAPDDPKIASTVRVIDAVLAAAFPGGPAWRRYPADHYGEHPDGSPFDGTGIGRPWPLLTGERAHFELARGDRVQAIALLRAMEAFAGPTGCLPEQVWDQPDVLDRGLVHGGPSGSAAPLGWAHSEYVKLCRSLADGRVFDLPAQAALRDDSRPRVTVWRAGDPIDPEGEPIDGILRIACFAPATISWASAAAEPRREATTDTGLGLHVVDVTDTGPLRITIHHREPREGDGMPLDFSTQPRSEQET